MTPVTLSIMMVQRISLSGYEQGLDVNQLCQEQVDIGVVGAGPAGLFAAIHAAQGGARVLVVDGNAMAGKKLLITGGGRCNVTHAGTARELLPTYRPYDRFLRYALHELPPAAIVEFLQAHGLPCTTGGDGCVFPQTQQAVDVRDALIRTAEKAGVCFQWGHEVETLRTTGSGFIVRSGGAIWQARRVILATGGCSYPRTGSRGQGYALAASLGHRIVGPIPVLIPLLTAEPWSLSLAGASLEQVILSVKVRKKTIQESGPLVFMQDGIGGPAVLNMSRHVVSGQLSRKHPTVLKLDLVPDMKIADLETTLLDNCQAHPKRSLPKLVSQWVPKRLAEQLCRNTGCVSDLSAGNLTKVLRRALVQQLKALELTVIGTRPLAEATVTRGGVATNEIDDKTMASKKCPGLFFAGEVIDVDGPCGGFNLQICWSTGALAGRGAACSSSV